MFIAGWISGVVGTLWFGRWYSERMAHKIIEQYAEEQDDDERTAGDS